MNRVAVETSQGDRFTVGLHGIVPMDYQEQYAQLLAALFDKYYKGDTSVVFGSISRELTLRCCPTPFWCGPDRNNERERIGKRIRDLREERGLEAKELAEYADIDASNLSRIEKGKFSPGLDVLCKIADAMDCSVEIVPKGFFRNRYEVHRAVRLAAPKKNRSLMITAKNSTFRLADCLAKYGEYHWQQTRYNVNVGDTVYVYVSEERAIKYKMKVEEVDVTKGDWMNQEEDFWVNKDRIEEDSTKYALLRLVEESHSGELTENNLIQHGFLRAPQGVKYLEGELLDFIERRF